MEMLQSPAHSLRNRGISLVKAPITPHLRHSHLLHILNGSETPLYAAKQLLCPNTETNSSFYMFLTL